MLRSNSATRPAAAGEQTVRSPPPPSSSAATSLARLTAAPCGKGERIACTILWDGKDAKIVRGKAIRPMGPATRQNGT
jgi:hypothetical protein